jgi:hypothetical protein
VTHVSPHSSPLAAPTQFSRIGPNVTGLMKTYGTGGDGLRSNEWGGNNGQESDL